MSHFTCIVLVPKDTPPANIENRVAELLAPYDENSEVPEYDKTCYCVGRAAKTAAIEAANRVETVNDIRARFNQTHAARIEEQNKLERLSRPFTPEEKKTYKQIEAFIRTKWNEAMEPWQKRETAALDAHPMKDKPARSCEECKGAGTHKSTYNPKSKWDWYQTGGRWNGYLRQFAKVPLGEKRVRDRPDGFGVKGDLKDNAFRVADLNIEHEDFGVFAIITPDGEWHAEGRMGWWGMTSDEDFTWEQVERRILVENPDAIAVLMDLHI